MRTICFVVGVALSFSVHAQPVPGSPGRPDRVAAVAHACPTFSWSSVRESAGYELRVYRAEHDIAPEDWELVLTERVHAGITSFTPEVGRCLEPGTEYAWLVGSRTEAGALEWSSALRVAVSPRPTVAQVEEALAVLDAYTRAVGAAAVSASSAPSPPEEPAQRSTSGIGIRESSPGTIPGVVGLRASVAAPGVGAAILGVADSTDAGSAAVVGLATADSGDVAGVVGRASSPAGTAGRFETSVGADLLRGVSNGAPLFVVDGTGAVSATAFTGDGGGLTGVDADLLDGMSPSALATQAALTAHASSTTNPHGVTATQTTPATAKGDLEIYDGDIVTRLPVGADGQVLTADSGTAAGVVWADDDAGVPVGTSCPPGFALAGFNDVGGLLCRAGGVRRTFSFLTVSDVAAAIGNDGTPVVVLSNEAGVDTFDLLFGRCSNPACQALSLRALGTATGRFDVAVGSDLRPIVVYGNEDNALVAQHCTDALCITTTTSTLDALGGSEPSIAIGSDGLPVIAYVDGNDDLKLAHCTDEPCTGRTLETIVVGPIESPSIAAGSPNPLVAFRDTAQTRLMLASCSDLTCTSAQIEQVDDSGDTGRNPSLAVAFGGSPVISYDKNGGQLVVAACYDPACTLANLLPVAAGSQPAISALAVGVDGRPVAAYRVNPLELAVVRCNDPLCSAFDYFSTTLVDEVGTVIDMVIGADGLPLLVYDDEVGAATLHCADPGCP
jgi:hypothetical protein